MAYIIVLNKNKTEYKLYRYYKVCVCVCTYKCVRVRECVYIVTNSKDSKENSLKNKPEMKYKNISNVFL